MLMAILRTSCPCPGFEILTVTLASVKLEEVELGSPTITVFQEVGYLMEKYLHEYVLLSGVWLAEAGLDVVVEEAVEYVVGDEEDCP